ncbi:MAG TPA: carbohydrate porin [Xanthomonadales bacterium]
MRTLALGILWVSLLSSTAPALAQTESELDVLRAELAQMRADYEQRIAQLEKRLDEAENRATEQLDDSAQAGNQPAQQAEPWLPEPSDNPIAGGGNNSSNPALGVIFQGQAWNYSNDPDNYEIPGFPLGGEAGLLPEGLAMGETEINISANVDDKFTAWLTVPIVFEDGETAVEVEEAWIETMTMPAGLSLRMGRFYSNIAYLNDKHSHSWDFADQPLPYQAFLGNQYVDDGLQLRWLAPLDQYLEFGAQVTRGENYPAGGAAHSGYGSYALHMRTGGDVGYSNSWQAGLSYLQADADQRESGDEDEPLLFTGQTEMVMAEFVWKWAPNGNNKQRNFVFQAEYMWRNEDGYYQVPGSGALPYDNDQRGWYMQAVYQPFPRWRVGLRYDRLSSDNPGPAFDGTPLMPASSDPRRYSLMTDWSNSEFSRLRLQYIFDQSGLEDDNQWGLQYIFSIGAHSAHSF